MGFSMRALFVSMSVCALLTAPAIGAAADDALAAGHDIIQHSNFKNPGDDQRSRLTIILRDKDNNEKKNVYRRLWKDYRGKNKKADKMVLFTEYPPDAEGAAFMRWAYTPQADRNADQWIYLPVLKKIRRVSIRDPGDSFLGSDLTYADISGRPIEADQHRLVQTLKRGGQEIYAVESVPVDKSGALYSKTVSWFIKDQDWDTCTKRQVDYFDKKGEPLKQQTLKWQRVKNAWVWDLVLVKNVQTDQTTQNKNTNVLVNVGLHDDDFAERALRVGE